MSLRFLPGKPVFGGVPSLEMGNQGRTRFGLPDGSEHIASVLVFFFLFGPPSECSEPS